MLRAAILIIALSPQPAAQLCGDCNGDGAVNILDALVAAQHGASLTIVVSPEFELCNVNGTPGGPPGGSVDVLDALSIAQHAAGLVPTLACTPAPPPPPPGWLQVTAAAPWHARMDHTTVVHGGRMWVIGGFWHLGLSNNHYLNDVWSSADGMSWVEETPAAPWTARTDHASASYDGKIWVIGGYFDNGSGLSYPRNDVWWSADGITWVEATPAAPWGERGAMGCVVHDGKLWVVGGAHQFSAYDDAWHTTDGINWTRASPAAGAPWTPVVGHGCVVHNTRIHVMPGIALAGITNDIWSSFDGSAWQLETPATPWGPRYDYSTVSHLGQMWMLGGHRDGASGNANDVWSSVDGVSWVQVTAAAPWATRKDHTSVVFAGRIWVMGGQEGATYFGDVWSYN